MTSLKNTFPKITTATFLCIMLLSYSAKSQSSANYPRVAGYFAVLHPIVAWNKNGAATNFGSSYTVAFPFGINILKSDSFGISMEVAPSIRTEKNISKMNNLLFHPGAMFRFKHGFTLVGRVAFETSGRFGFTPVFNQVLAKGKSSNLFVAVPLPVRFGNNLPSSVGAGIQFGVGF